MRPALVATGILVVLIAALGALTAGPAAAEDKTVDVGPAYFCSPSFEDVSCETDVAAGDTVTWTVSSGTHTVSECTDDTFSSCSSGFESGIIFPQDTFAQTFDSPGTFYYRCNLHPTQMIGEVVVAAATATPTPAPATTAPAAATAAATTAAASATAAQLPSTGGDTGSTPGDAPWYGMLMLAGLLFSGAALSFAAARRS